MMLKTDKKSHRLLSNKTFKVKVIFFFKCFRFCHHFRCCFSLNFIVQKSLNGIMSYIFYLLNWISSCYSFNRCNQTFSPRYGSIYWKYPLLFIFKITLYYLNTTSYLVFLNYHFLFNRTLIKYWKYIETHLSTRSKINVIFMYIYNSM